MAFGKQRKLEPANWPLIQMNIPQRDTLKTARLAVAYLVSLCISVSGATHYVWQSSPGPLPPYGNWTTAATNIQDAVVSAGPGDLILVTNGLYQTGGMFFSGSNRVSIYKPVTVRSVNGPDVTVIKGYQDTATPTGSSAVRCAYLAGGAVLSGFTLTNGGTQDGGSGGGVKSQSTFAIVTNCVIVGNSARWVGGGAYSGTVIRCTLSDNDALSGGAAGQSTLIDCLLVGNFARDIGGAATGCSLVNCTVVTNSSTSYAGSVEGCSARNSILYYNHSYYTNDDSNSGVNFTNCCLSFPAPSGLNNSTSAPLFANLAAGDLHLQPASACINAGDNNYATNAADLDGNPRIVGGTVDIGAYEFQSPQSVISYAWLQHYGLPTDGSADYANSDTDPHNNWQEWKADTDPTNSDSFLEMLSPVDDPSGVLVQWKSTNSRTYFLDRATDFAAQSSFSNVASNIMGAAGKTTYTDATATNGGPFFYRVGVQE